MGIRKNPRFLRFQNQYIIGNFPLWIIEDCPRFLRSSSTAHSRLSLDTSSFVWRRLQILKWRIYKLNLNNFDCFAVSTTDNSSAGLTARYIASHALILMGSTAGFMDRSILATSLHIIYYGENIPTLTLWGSLDAFGLNKECDGLPALLHLQNLQLLWQHF